MSLQDPVLEYVVQQVALGRCILFLGAGAHCPPVDATKPYAYPASERPPLGSELSLLLAEKAGFQKHFPNESALNLQRVSLHYEISRSRRELVNELKAAVYDGKKPSAAIRALACLNFPLVITTNYDHLYEDALHMAGKRPIKSIYQPNENQRTQDLRDDPEEMRPFIFKIHGDVERPESLVITDEDYIQFVMRMGDKEDFHPIPSTLRFFFRKWPTLFVGYSLMDYNFRLLFKTLRWRMDPSDFPKTYAVDRDLDRLIEQIWCNQRQYLRFIVKDIWTFVPELYGRLKGEEMPA